MKKVFVVTTIWSEKEKKQIKKIIGEFTEYMNAIIFKNAYNEFYEANATIVDEDELFNK